MALYADKGTEELTGKLEGFLRSFEKNTGRELDPKELRAALCSLYELKKNKMIMASFETETPGTLRLLIDSFDDLMPSKPKVIEPRVIETIGPRKRKPNRG